MFRNARNVCAVLLSVLLVTGIMGLSVAQMPDWTPPPAPALKAEVRPEQPNPAWVWRPGHWKFEGRDYVWVPGEYVEKPLRGEHWVHGYWAQGARGEWIRIPGHWQP